MSTMDALPHSGTNKERAVIRPATAKYQEVLQLMAEAKN